MIASYSMERNSALLSDTQVSNSFIIHYMNDAPSNYIKVYLFALMQYQNLSFVNDDISLALKITEEETMQAFAYWQRQGLIVIVRESPLHIEFLRNGNVIHKTSGLYKQLLDSLQLILGTRLLTATDIKSIYEWIEVFGLSEDAIEVLVMHCLDIKGSRVSFKYIDSVARSWADSKIQTAQDAKEYISQHTVYHNGAREILHRFGLRRNPTDDEVDLYRKWIVEYKLSPEAIVDISKTTTGASNPSFGYLASVVSSFIENGIVDTKSISEYQKELALLDDFCRVICKTSLQKSAPTKAQRDKIESWLKDFHMSRDMLIMLAKYAADKARPFDFMCKRVKLWNDENIHNYDDAKANLESIKQAQPSTPQKGYKQRKYTAEDMKKLVVSLDDDDE